MAYKPIPNPATWTQADWYVDWVAGDDKNDGLAPGTAVKTVMGGVVAKWGTTSPELGQTTTLHILSSQPLGAEEINLEPILTGPFTFNIVGTPVLDAAFVLGVVTPKNRATNQQFSALGFPGTAFNGQLVVNTTVGKSSHALVRAVGVNTQLSQPLAPIAVGSNMAQPVPAEVDTWLAGDTVELFHWPLLNLSIVNVKCLVASGGGTNPGLWLQSLFVPDASGAPGQNVFCPRAEDGYVVINDCWIDPELTTGAAAAPIATGTTGPAVVQCYINGSADGPATLMGGIITSVWNFAGVTIIGDDAIHEGGIALVANCLMFVDSLNNAGAIELVNASTLLMSFPLATLGVIWGTGSLDVRNNCVIRKPGVGTWATQLFVANIALNGFPTGTSYTPGAPGIWTSGIALTPANLDANPGGLQDPFSGARYTT